MTTLRLAIDATGMRRGAEEAKRATDEVKGGAEQAVAATRRLDQTFEELSTGSSVTARDSATRLGRSFEVLRPQLDGLTLSGSTAKQSMEGVGKALTAAGSVQGAVAGLSQIQAGFGGIAGAAQGASLALLQSGKAFESIRGLRIEQQVQQTAFNYATLSNEIRNTTVVSNGLAAAWRAHPVLLIASGISIAASALSLFTAGMDEAKEAADSLAFGVDGLRSALRSLSEIRAAQMRAFEFGDAGELNRQRLGELDRLKGLSVSLRSGKDADKPYPIADLALALGTSEESLRRVLGDQGIARTPDRVIETGRGALMRPGVELGATPDAAIRATEARIRRLEQEFSGAAGSRFGRGEDPDAVRRDRKADLIGPPAPPVADLRDPVPEHGREGVRDYVLAVREETRLAAMAREEREQEIAVLHAKAIAQQQNTALTAEEERIIREQVGLQQEMAQLRDLGEDVGAAIGSGLLNAAQAGGNLRSVLAGIIQDLGRIAQQMAIRGLSGAFGQAFAGGAGTGAGFGTTPTQVQSDFGTFNNNAS